MTIKVLDPTFAPARKTEGMAPRPDTLNGRRIGLLANDKMNAAALLEAIHEVLADSFSLGPPVRLNRGNASAPAPANMLEDVAREVDVAILANGD